MYVDAASGVRTWDCRIEGADKSSGLRALSQVLLFYKKVFEFSNSLTTLVGVGLLILYLIK